MISLDPKCVFVPYSEALPESEQRKAERKHFKRCFLGFHKWVHEDARGIVSIDLLARCSKCHWWKLTRVNGYDSQSNLFGPDRFKYIPVEETKAIKKPWWRLV